MSSNIPMMRAGTGSSTRVLEVVHIGQAPLCQRGHHCVSRGKVIEERSVGDIGSLADLLDRRRSNALDQEQVERRLQNALIDLTLATIDPVHRNGVYGRASPGLSDSDAPTIFDTALGFAGGKLVSSRSVKTSPFGRHLISRTSGSKGRPSRAAKTRSGSR
jgi:hypothetical protein